MREMNQFRQIACYQKWNSGLWAVILKETDEMIGQCGLRMQPWKDDEVLEIGFIKEKTDERKNSI